MKITSPFHSVVSFSCVSTGDLNRYSAHPEELKLLSPRAIKKRRTEFLLGRLAAFRAIKALGIHPEPVLRGKHREPLWQDGIVGSISHKGDIAIAAVVRKTIADGIGVDLERMDEPVNLRISTRVCHPSEMDWIFKSQNNRDIRFRMVFSAKEAGFKAFFPIQQIYLNYLDAELRWNEGRQSFGGSLLKSAGNHYPVGCSFEVGCRIIGNFVLSSITLPPRSPSNPSG